MQQIPTIIKKESANESNIFPSICIPPSQNNSSIINPKNKLNEPKSNISENSKPIGIYNFNRNKSEINSLQDEIDNIVSGFIMENKDNIIQYIAKEVENKLNEKINPMTTEINSIKSDFTELYQNELNEFKESNVLNDCHDHINNIQNKMNITDENMENYTNDIKGFNVSNKRLKFLNQLNDNLEQFILNVKNEPENSDYALELQNKKEESINREFDKVFYETMSLLKNMDDNLKNEKNIIQNGLNINNDFKQAVNNFENKFNYDKPVSSGNKSNNCNNNSNKKINEEFNINNVPNFFDIDMC